MKLMNDIVVIYGSGSQILQNVDELLAKLKINRTCIRPKAKLKKFASSTSPYRVKFGETSESLRRISSKLSYGREFPAICSERQTHCINPFTLYLG